MEAAMSRTTPIAIEVSEHYEIDRQRAEGERSGIRQLSDADRIRAAQFADFMPSRIVATRQNKLIPLSPEKSARR